MPPKIHGAVEDSYDNQCAGIDLKQNKMPSLPCNLASWKQLFPETPAGGIPGYLSKLPVEAFQITFLLLLTPCITGILADFLKIRNS